MIVNVLLILFSKISINANSSEVTDINQYKFFRWNVIYLITVNILDKLLKTSLAIIYTMGAIIRLTSRTILVCATMVSLFNLFIDIDSSVDQCTSNFKLIKFKKFFRLTLFDIKVSRYYCIAGVHITHECKLS